MALAIRDAKRLGSQLVFGYGSGLRPRGDWGQEHRKEITGSRETGVLLLDYVARRRRESRNYASRTDFRENYLPVIWQVRLLSLMGLR